MEPVDWKPNVASDRTEWGWTELNRNEKDILQDSAGFCKSTKEGLRFCGWISMGSMEPIEWGFLR